VKGFSKNCLRRGVWLGAMISLAIVAEAAQADSIYDVTIDTSGLSSQDVTLAFDFIAGGGAQNNSVDISKFTSDGVLGAAGPNSGTVSGSLPGGVTLTTANGTSFFNENLQHITLGSTLTFQVDATTVWGGGAPDALSFFILDSTAAQSLIATSDPTGADSLFFLEADGQPNGHLSVFTTTQGITATLVPSTVPLPAAIWLLLSGLSGVGVLRVRNRGLV
jgi:hypothetical protein